MCNIFNWISPSLSRVRGPRLTSPSLSAASSRGKETARNFVRLCPSTLLTPLRTTLTVVADGTCNYFLLPCGLSRCKISSLSFSLFPPMCVRVRVYVCVRVVDHSRACTRVQRDYAASFLRFSTLHHPRRTPFVSSLWQPRSLKLALGPAEKNSEELVTEKRRTDDSPGDAGEERGWRASRLENWKAKWRLKA